MHVSKIKLTEAEGLARHVLRLYDNHSNANIKPSLFDANDMHDLDLDTFKAVMDDAVKRHKAITGRSVRSDAVGVLGFVLTVPEQYRGNSDHETAILEAAVDWARQRFPSCPIAWNAIHRDEVANNGVGEKVNAVHLHLGLVPVDSTGRLNAKALINRQVLLGLHDDLDRYLHYHLGDWYKGGVVAYDHEARGAGKATMDELKAIHRATDAHEASCRKSMKAMREVTAEREYLTEDYANLEYNAKVIDDWRERLEDKERKLDTKDALLKTRETSIEARERFVGRVEGIQQREREVNAKEARLEALEQSLEKREGLLRERDADLTKREGLLTSAVKALCEAIDRVSLRLAPSARTALKDAFERFGAKVPSIAPYFVRDKGGRTRD